MFTKAKNTFINTLLLQPSLPHNLLHPRIHIFWSLFYSNIVSSLTYYLPSTLPPPSVFLSPTLQAIIWDRTQPLITEWMCAPVSLAPGGHLSCCRSGHEVRVVGIHSFIPSLSFLFCMMTVFGSPACTLLGGTLINPTISQLRWCTLHVACSSRSMLRCSCGGTPWSVSFYFNWLSTFLLWMFCCLYFLYVCWWTSSPLLILSYYSSDPPLNSSFDSYWRQNNKAIIYHLISSARALPLSTIDRVTALHSSWLVTACTGSQLHHRCFCVVMESSTVS